MVRPRAIMRATARVSPKSIWMVLLVAGGDSLDSVSPEFGKALTSLYRGKVKWKSETLARILRSTNEPT
jgi:hypothetical protein